MAGCCCFELVEVEVAEGFAGVRGLFGFAEGFFEFFAEDVVAIFLGFDGLGKDGVAAGILFAHTLGGGGEVVEGALAGRGGVADDGLGDRVDAEDGTAVGAAYLESDGFVFLLGCHGGILPLLIVNACGATAKYAKLGAEFAEFRYASVCAFARKQRVSALRTQGEDVGSPVETAVSLWDGVCRSRVARKALRA